MDKRSKSKGDGGVPAKKRSAFAYKSSAKKPAGFPATSSRDHAQQPTLSAIMDAFVDAGEAWAIKRYGPLVKEYRTAPGVVAQVAFLRRKLAKQFPALAARSGATKGSSPASRRPSEQRATKGSGRGSAKATPSIPKKK